MGLDITAYRGLALAPDAKVDEDGNPEDWKNHVLVDKLTLDWTEENWPGRTAPLQPGIYTAAEVHSFPAGSYSGYNRWREWLCEAAGHGSTEAIWHAQNPSGPFVELINFADNEGVIGPTVSAKLARDFADNEARILANADAWNADKYRQWRKAFELAADGGFVDFR